MSRWLMGSKLRPPPFSPAATSIEAMLLSVWLISAKSPCVMLRSWPTRMASRMRAPWAAMAWAVEMILLRYGRGRSKESAFILCLNLSRLYWKSLPSTSEAGRRTRGGLREVPVLRQT